jgi:hypothetical protein
MVVRGVRGLRRGKSLTVTITTSNASNASLQLKSRLNTHCRYLSIAFADTFPLHIFLAIELS